MSWEAIVQIWNNVWRGRQQQAVQAQVEHRNDFSAIDLAKNTLIIQLQEWITRLEAKIATAEQRSEECEKRYAGLVTKVHGLENWNQSQETRIQGLEDSREAGTSQ